jgi:hypothetical protein
MQYTPPQLINTHNPPGEMQCGDGTTASREPTCVTGQGVDDPYCKNGGTNRYICGNGLSAGGNLNKCKTGSSADTGCVPGGTVT